MKPHIFLDMDGVIADFVGGALAAHGRADIPLADCRWNIHDSLGLTPEQFWKPLETPDFWAGLRPLPDGMAVLDDIRRSAAENGLEYGVLSSAGCRGSKDGKDAWLRRHAPDLLKGATYTAEKWRSAGPHKLLIDDNDDNCRLFRQHGGFAALVPRPWNAGRDSCLTHPDPLRTGHDFDHEIDFASYWLHELDHVLNEHTPWWRCGACDNPRRSA